MSTRILPLNVNIPLTVNVVDNDGQPVPIPLDATVQVAIGRADYTETFATYDADPNHASGLHNPAANWPGGVVVVDVVDADTDPINCLKLATEVDVNGTKYRGVHLLETTRVLIQ